MENEKRVITLTFGDFAENHVGMEKLGTSIDSNYLFPVEHLQELEKVMCEQYNTELINLDEEVTVSILIIRGYFSEIQDKMFEQLSKLEWDKKYYDVRRSKVLNKIARWNLCFSNFSREPDYENKKGRVVSIVEVSGLSDVVSKVRKDFIDGYIDLPEMAVEGNYYYDEKSGIGYHGDSERNFTIGARFGGTCPLVYQWFQNSKPLGESINISLNGGDLYVMSDKALGRDWKKQSLLTLRHSAGSDKYTRVPGKSLSKNQCKGITQKGSRCKRMVNGTFCKAHEPK